MKHFLIFLAIFAVIGCDDGGGPDAKVEDNRMEQAKLLRSTFDKVGGNFDKMTPDEKAEILKIYKGNESDAKRAWSMMQAGGLAGPSGSASSMSAAPGVQKGGN